MCTIFPLPALPPPPKERKKFIPYTFSIQREAPRSERKESMYTRILMQGAGGHDSGISHIALSKEEAKGELSTQLFRHPPHNPPAPPHKLPAKVTVFSKRTRSQSTCRIFGINPIFIIVFLGSLETSSAQCPSSSIVGPVRSILW